MECKKRKRAERTSYHQYCEYLKLLEEDSVFKSAIKNPTKNADNLANCWEHLKKRLNACKSGPSLSTSDWRKRFQDWRNTTRAKYRKIKEQSKQGEEVKDLKLKISTLEARGLAAWDKIIVTSSQTVPIVDDLHEEIEVKDEERSCESSDLNPIWLPDEDEDSYLEERSSFSETPPKKQKSTLNETNLIENERANIDKMKLHLEFEKFRFEVAKYKFINPSFKFDVEPFQK